MRLDDFLDDTCAECREPFEAKRYDQRFCCKPCRTIFEARERSAVERVERRKARSGYVCPECDRVFDAKHLSTQIYCSRRCKTREMLRRYRARLGEDEFLKRRRESSRRSKARRRAMLHSMLRGVAEGQRKPLEIKGTGPQHDAT